MTTTSTVLIANALLADGDGVSDGPRDVLVADDRIAAIGEPGSLTAQAGTETSVTDAAGRVLLPGLVDAHSHAGGRVFDPDVQLALLRQGVTTVIAGQDGVGYAPGDGAYATEYFAAIDGANPAYAGGGIGALLAAYDDATPLNVAALVPAGTVRFEVMGRSTDAPSPADLAAMTALVADGLAAGAVGLSTGLDYVPGIFASTAELAALARPLAEAGGVFVSHMRGGYETGSAAGIAELAEISRVSGAPIHVSHFHAEPHLVLGLLDELEASGIDATFDAYPYARGCSLLAMPILPPAITVRPVDEALALLVDPGERARLLAEWFPSIVDYPSLGPDWPGMLTFGHIAAAEYGWAHGLTIAAASARAGRSPAEFALDVLVASRLEVNVVMAVRYRRTDDDLAQILSQPAATGGSDGIFVGRHPHPRARGSFPRYFAELVRRHGVLDLAGFAALVSTRAVDRFALGERGRVRVGEIADLVLADPGRVRDGATYDAPLGLGEGIDDVLVAGVRVLADGALTGKTPGRGIRRAVRTTSQTGAA
ncbi:N-acyl-D-aspartate/D-glutamate deacylase [Agromyces protaetiae]|uniref:N-acyl-D-aspartate/D-glutamate deacylase n=1 Tax=Agromyces protaetiae TaxID=2509455 RepID=A0A4P6FFJ6_9MICO|nr:amidohydrolase family protein [Agromyces protaetiae]QAY74734.1 N-acyl-D-aspartate/D-glutamate deacylase [Agromyces protaetiae]